MVKLRTPAAIFALFGLFMSTQPAHAQPASEVFIGYSYLRASPGEAETEGGAAVELDSENLHGGEVYGTFFLSRRTGIDVSFGYHNGSIVLSESDVDPEFGVGPDIDFKEVTLLVGPRVRLVTKRRLTASVRALFGISNGDAKAAAGVIAVRADETAFAMSFGVSLTLNLNDVFAYRVAQPEVFITTFGDGAQTNFRVSTGIVIRYGQ